MSKHDTKGPPEFPPKAVNTSTRDAGLSDLTQMARQAFEEQRRKQSVALADSILKIDPENKEAQVIRAWVRQDLKKQLRYARIQIEEARRENVLSLWDRAERLVREVLSIHPDDEEAKALLAEVIPAQQALVERLEPENEPAHEDRLYEPQRVSFRLSQVNRSTAVGIIFGILVILGIAFFAMRKPATNETTNDEEANTAQPAGADEIPASAISEPSVGSFRLYVVPDIGVQLKVDDSPAQPVSQTIELPPGQHRLFFTAAGYLPQTLSETLQAGETRKLAVFLVPIVAARKSTDRSGSESATATSPLGGSTNAPAERSPARDANAAPPVELAKGTLAISAAVPVEVYFAGKRLGTTPITVDLPPGDQSVEYRYDDLRKTVSHQIRSNEKTSTTVVFERIVRIQTKPTWAEVSVEGPKPRALGDTPLDNVTVDVGSVLVFRNPKFAEKRHRVSGKDEVIVVSFP